MSIEEIITSTEDEEIIKYKVLSLLKSHIALFRKNKLYPSLTELVNTVVKLENMINVTLEVSEPENNTGFSEELEFPESTESEFSLLVRWVINEINNAIDEAIPLFEFVEDDLDIVRLSGKATNKEKGYFIVPDKSKGALNIYYFTSIHFDTGKSPIKSMKIRFLDVIYEEDIIYKSKHPAIKTIMDFIADKRATVFLCNTELHFPFEETILPIAKKKLLKLISL